MCVPPEAPPGGVSSIFFSDSAEARPRSVGLATRPQGQRRHPRSSFNISKLLKNSRVAQTIREVPTNDGPKLVIKHKCATFQRTPRNEESPKQPSNLQRTNKRIKEATYVLKTNTQTSIYFIFIPSSHGPLIVLVVKVVERRPPCRENDLASPHEPPTWLPAGAVPRVNIQAFKENNSTRGYKGAMLFGSL